MEKSKYKIQTVSWLLAGLYIVWALGLKSFLAPFLPPLALTLIEKLLLTGFFVSHALGYYSWQTVAFFALVLTIVVNLFENLSVMFGFPFGHYVHNGSPKLFNIPYVVTLTYLGLGYVSWMVTQVLLRRTGYRSWHKQVFIAPLTAAFVFTSWDFCVDPIYGALAKAYVYKDPGPWFGTPMGNYFGWMLTTICIYLPVSLFLRNRGEAHGKVQAEPRASYWLQAVLVYLMIAVEIILGNLKGKSVDITLVNGKVWNSGDIWAASSLATLFTMVFISLLALVTLYGADDGTPEKETSQQTEKK